MLTWHKHQIYTIFIIIPMVMTSDLQACGKPGLKFLLGDALTGTTNCVGPDGLPYPSAAVAKFARINRSDRTGRSYNPPNPLEVQKRLLNTFEVANSLQAKYGVRQERNVLFDNESYISDSPKRSRPTRCSSEPGGRLCKTKYNTTAPLYGVSLTSGQPVTIVQKFPDLLQQVIFEVCESKECDILHGECIQTYVPYLFLVIPLGPVTLTGQDYVLVESGCVCKPKFGSQSNEPDIADALPGFV